ncbi:glycosyltransferase family 2 protein [Salinarimonas sp.]|uniref:glycosyltransferase family 2 protein n=1 Tax=Salinarimonas sp. TaxID=2766526 RepID=UPI0032D991AF
MKIVIPMAGSDELFRKHGFPFAKPLIEIDGRPLVEHAFERLRAADGARAIFVIRKEDDLRFHLREVLELLEPDAVVIRADGETAGAACSALLAIEHIGLDEELVVANADQILAFDLGEALADFRSRGLDAGTVVFDSVHPRWSYVKTDESGLVIEAAEKRPVSRDATAGVYWFAKGRDFVEAVQAMIRKDASVRGGYFVCPCFNEMILAHKRIGVFRIRRDQYVSLATPQAVEEYEQTLLARRRSRAG